MLDERTLASKRIYSGRIFDVIQYEVELPNGHTSLRDIVVNPDAAAVVPMLDDGRVIMVRQYRKSAEKTLLEIPAGKIDPGELPLEAAYRELREETGYRCTDMALLFSMRVSPGFSTEVIHIYVARGLSPGQTDFDEDEFVETDAVPLSELIGRINRGEIEDGKSIAGLLAVAMQETERM